MDKLKVINPRKQWVKDEINRLIREWEDWQKHVSSITDHSYDDQTQLDVFADGVENMERHSILQMKTVTFLESNIEGHWFINGRDGNSCDRSDLRLSYRVAHRLRELREIEASLEYALLTDSYWKQKAKEMIEKITDKTPEAALDIATSYLKNPLVSDAEA